MDLTLQVQDTVTLSCILSLYLEGGDRLYGGESVARNSP